MTEKRRDLPPPDTDGVSFGPNLKAKPPRTAKERAEWGKMREPVYKEGLGRKVGGWLAGILTAWKR